MARRFCNNCNKKTDGLIINYSEYSKFKCYECKNEVELIEDAKKKSPSIIINCSGFGAGGINRI